MPPFRPQITLEVSGWVLFLNSTCEIRAKVYWSSEGRTIKFTADISYWMVWTSADGWMLAEWKGLWGRLCRERGKEANRTAAWVWRSCRLYCRCSSPLRDRAKCRQNNLEHKDYSSTSMSFGHANLSGPIIHLASGHPQAHEDRAENKPYSGEMSLHSWNFFPHFKLFNKLF